jgi:hypothetical protein
MLFLAHYFLFAVARDIQDAVPEALGVVLVVREVAVFLDQVPDVHLRIQHLDLSIPTLSRCPKYPLVCKLVQLKVEAVLEGLCSLVLQLWKPAHGQLT